MVVLARAGTAAHAAYRTLAAPTLREHPNDAVLATFITEGPRARARLTRRACHCYSCSARLNKLLTFPCHDADAAGPVSVLRAPRLELHTFAALLSPAHQISRCAADLLQGSRSGVNYERRRFERAIPRGIDPATALPKTAAWLRNVMQTVR